MGSSTSFLALERGEINAITTDLSAIRSNRPQWLRPDSAFHVLLQFARKTRHPDFPAVPTARELASTDDARELIECAEYSFTMAMPFAAPPGLPEDRLAALRGAFDAVHRDQQYLADAIARGEEVSPVRGVDVAAAIEKLAAMPPATFQKLGRLISSDHVR